jgi:hypothetical protein
MTVLKHDLSHIYWIGGSPCAGKSSIARRLTDQYGFRYYKCDDCYEDHMSRCNPDQHPTMFKIKDLTWNQVWSSKFCSVTVDQQIHEVIEQYREQFQLILEDLLALPKTTKIVVEGAAVLPAMAAPALLHPHQGIWLFPTPEFQISHYSNREWIHGILEHYEDPEKAFSNWMARDIGFANQMTSQTIRCNLRSFLVDGTVSIEDTFAMVEKHFQLK